jgi:uncharacterized zinc-type alcohol dehydrogenase-like protein
VLVDILYFSLSYGDLASTRGALGDIRYPYVPGNEAVGRVKSRGSKVSAVKEGDLVGVGYFRKNCGKCEFCKEGREQFCVGVHKLDRLTCGVRFGTFATAVVVDQSWCIQLPKTIDLVRAAPLMTSGLSAFSFLKAHKVGKGTKLAIYGLGGLGHLLAKYALHLEAEVTIFTRSHEKVKFHVDGKHQPVVKDIS